MNDPISTSNNHSAGIGGAGGDFSFDDVLMFIESGETIPVIGPELLTAPAGGGGTLYECLAAPLAAELKIDLSKIEDSRSLNSIIVESDMFRNRPQMVYSRLKGVLDRLISSKSFPVPEPLMKLAAITPFQLFLTTTFDPLMTAAMNQTRFGGGGGTLSLSYSPSRFDDLPADWAENPRPAVYHLFGRASAQPGDYALTEGDVLEFLHTMQSREGRPQRLFDKLYRSNLLLLGVGFPDWLARFFLRVAKNSRLGETRQRIEIVADSRLNQNESLVYFVNQFSRETSIYGGCAVDFVSGLYDRWKEKEKEAVKDPEAGKMEAGADGEEMKPGAVFISYSSDNREQAKRIRDTLDEKGIDVWYDRDKLHAGNFYESVIRNNIRTCSLFLPVISNQATARTEAFFRKEWCWAVDRLSEFFGSQRPFIFPVVVDDTPPDHVQLPEQFSAVQWIQAPGGTLPGDSIERVREAVRSIRKRERVNA